MDPIIIRIGPNVNRELEHISIDSIIEKEIASKNIKDKKNYELKNKV